MSPASADEKSKAAAAEDLLTLMNAEKLMADMITAQRGMFRSQMQRAIASDPAMAPVRKEMEASLGEVEEQMIGLLRKALAWDQVKPKMMAIYTDLLTEEEMKAMAEFYRTPAGQAMLKKMPEITRRSSEVGMNQVQAVMPEMQGIVQKWLEKVKAAAAQPAK